LEYNLLAERYSVVEFRIIVSEYNMNRQVGLHDRVGKDSWKVFGRGTQVTVEGHRQRWDFKEKGKLRTRNQRDRYVQERQERQILQEKIRDMHALYRKPGQVEGDRLVVAVVGHSLLVDVQNHAIRSDNLSMDLSLSRVDVHWMVSRGLNYDKLIRYILPELSQLKPRVIYFQVMGNDIDSQLSPESIVAQYVQLAKVYTGSGHIARVLISTVIKRTRSFKLSAEKFEEKRTKVNEALREALLVKPFPSKGRPPLDVYRDPKVWIWEQARLKNPKLTRDGVHLQEDSLRRLFFNLRMAIWEATRDMVV
jgi:hypothetical protein